MNANRKTTAVIGSLFILAIFAYASGDGQISPVIQKPANLAMAKTQLITGASLLLANNLFIVLIGILVFPILKTYHKKIALIYTSTRVIEAILLTIGAIGFLTLPSLNAPAGSFKEWAQWASQNNFLCYQIAMLILGAGSVVFCGLLYDTQLIPRWLSVWGIIGYFGLLVGALAELFGFPIGIMLAIPGGLFELVFGIWLMFKGFGAVSQTNVKLA